MPKKKPKRRKRPKPQQTQRLLISYWPLLDYKSVIDIPGQQTADIDSVAKVIDSAPECPPIRAVVWAFYPFDAESPDEAGVIPVFVMEKADEVSGHLVEWMEGDTDRFKLYIEQRGDSYAVALIPEIQKSIDRFKLARLMYHEDMVTDNEFTVIYQTLGVWCPAATTYEQVRDRVPKPCHVGFLDLDKLDADNLQDLDPDNITVAGPFEFGELDKRTQGHLDHLFEGEQ